MDQSAKYDNQTNLSLTPSLVSICPSLSRICPHLYQFVILSFYLVALSLSHIQTYTLLNNLHGMHSYSSYSFFIRRKISSLKSSHRLLQKAQCQDQIYQIVRRSQLLYKPFLGIYFRREAALQISLSALPLH